MADLGGCLRRGESVHDVVRPGAPAWETFCFATCLGVDVLQRRSGPPTCLPPARSARTPFRSPSSNQDDIVPGAKPQRTSARSMTGDAPPTARRRRPRPVRSHRRRPRRPGAKPPRNITISAEKNDPDIEGRSPGELHDGQRDGGRAPKASAPLEERGVAQPRTTRNATGTRKTNAPDTGPPAAGASIAGPRSGRKNHRTQGGALRKT